MLGGADPCAAGFGVAGKKKLVVAGFFLRNGFRGARRCFVAIVGEYEPGRSGKIGDGAHRGDFQIIFRYISKVAHPIL